MTYYILIIKFDFGKNGTIFS